MQGSQWARLGFPPADRAARWRELRARSRRRKEEGATKWGRRGWSWSGAVVGRLGGRGETGTIKDWLRVYILVTFRKRRTFISFPRPPSTPGVGTFLAEAGDGWSFCSLFLGSKVRVRSCFLAVAIVGRH